MNKKLYRVTGMTCGSCELRIERKLKTIAGIQKVKANHTTGKAILTFSDESDLAQIQAALVDDGYKITPWDKQKNPEESKEDRNDYFEIIGIFIIVAVLYWILKTVGILPDTFSVQEGMSYGFVFAIGLVVAFSSCIAVTGGLLLAVSARYAENHPDLSGWQRFKPQIYFNLGRLAGYAIFGGLVGALGSILVLSAGANGWTLFIAGLVMLVLGFQILNLFPGLRSFMPRLPKFLAHRIHDLQQEHHPVAVFSLGGLTFFLPCGFTQALQLYVLSQGDWKQGAITMFIFALGTLPALLFVGTLSSFVKGAIRHYMFRVAGVLIVLVGIFNVKSGLVLASFYPNISFSGSDVVNQPANVTIENGKQIARMKVDYLDYYPSQFVIKKGIPVEWIID